MTYGPVPRDEAERFWVKVDQRGPDECWPWLGRRNSLGYGCFDVGPPWRSDKAHRVALRLSGVEVDGKEICHRCDNPPCCNPAHLTAGTHTDNMGDMAARGRSHQRRKSHCPQGHPYDEANTYLYAGRRYCRACHRERS